VGKFLKLRLSIQLFAVVLLAVPYQIVVAQEVPQMTADQLQYWILEQESAKGNGGQPATGRMPGARIIAASCDPDADPADDNNRLKGEQVDQYFPKKSCVGQSADGSTNGISRDNFKVKIAFDPSYNPDSDETGVSGMMFNTTVPGELQLPADVTEPFYDENGLVITGATAEDVLHVDEGAAALYNDKPIYKAPTIMKIPGSGPILDQNFKEQVYTVACGGHAAGEKLVYALNAKIYSKDCIPAIDCNNKQLVGGGTLYPLKDEAGATCSPKLVPGGQILSVRGPATTQPTLASLFIARFFNDYSDDEKKAIQADDPKKGEAWIMTGQTLYLQENTRVSFELVDKGAYACVQAYTQNPSIEWRVEKDAPKNMYDVMDLQYVKDSVDPATGQPSADGHIYTKSYDTTVNCVRAPPSPKAGILLEFGSMISPTCTNYDSSDSHWKTPFTGVVVQCIEETIMNIFVPQSTTYKDATGQVHDITADTTFFSQMQSRLKSAIRAVLALYIIFFGYKLMVGKQVPQQAEWMWLGLKMALVIYFATGSGMTDLLPKMLSVSKGLSLIVMQAGLGETDPTVSAAQMAQYSAQDTLSKAQNDLEAKIQEIEMLKSKAAVSSQTELDLKAKIDELNDALAKAKTALEAALTEQTSAQKGRDQILAGIAPLQASYDTALATRDSFQASINNFTTTNQIKDGDFETPIAGNWPYKSLNGWTSDMGAGIELPLINGQHIVELDSSNNSNMYQNIQTYPGITYTLTFAYSPRPGASADSNDIEIWVNGQLLQTEKGEIKSNSNDFTQAVYTNKTITFNGTGSNMKVEFRAAGANDGLGGLLDNIQITPNALPASLSSQLASYNTTLKNAATALCTAGGICYGGVLNVADGGYYPSSPLKAAEDNLSSATKNYNDAQNKYAAIAAAIQTANDQFKAATDFSANKNKLISDAIAEKTALEAAVKSALDAFNQAINNVNNALSTVKTESQYVNNGYNYCDFRYDTGYKNASMQLWDMVDCKLSVYLGIGANQSDPKAPQVLLIGVTSLFSTEYGIPIFIFTIIFLVFFIIITIRIVHVYIMAFMAVVMLVYISPLIIPSVLFNFTKYLYEAWLKQLISFLVQPVILFGFLTIMFAAMDSVVFGGNHNFVADNSPVNNKIRSEKDFTKPATKPEECKDPKAMACIYQTISYGSYNYPGNGVRLLNIHTVSLDKDNRDFNVFIGLLKLMLICFIVKVLIDTVEQLVVFITGAMGTGAAGMSPNTKAMGPAETLSNMRGIASKTSSMPGKTFDAVKGGANTANKKRLAIRDFKREMQLGQNTYKGGAMAGKAATINKATGDKVAGSNKEMHDKAKAGDAASANKFMMQKEAMANARAKPAGTTGESGEGENKPARPNAATPQTPAGRGAIPTTPAKPAAIPKPPSTSTDGTSSSGSSGKPSTTTGKPTGNNRPTNKNPGMKRNNLALKPSDKPMGDRSNKGNDSKGDGSGE
jgi:type IV secretory pathway VirB6-like protein